MATPGLPLTAFGSMSMDHKRRGSLIGWLRMATSGASGWLRLHVLPELHGATREAARGQRGVDPVSEASVKLASGIPFVPDEQLRSALAGAGLSHRG